VQIKRLRKRNSITKVEQREIKELTPSLEGIWVGKKINIDLIGSNGEAKSRLQ
jgi:hypothetical protein